MSNISISGFDYPYAQGTYNVGPVELRIWFVGGPGNQFIDSLGNTVPYGSGAQFYKAVSCTVGSNTITIPSFVLPSTDNSSNISAVARAQFYVNGSPATFLFSDWIITATLGASISYNSLYTFNLAAVLPATLDPAYLTAPQVTALITAAVGSLNNASSVIKGITFLDTDPASATVPTAIGVNSRRATDFYNIVAYGALTTNTAAQNATAVAAAITAASAAGGGVYIPVGTFNITSATFTVPVQFALGASILRYTGTLTFSKPINADIAAQHFSANGGSVAAIGDVYPNWWAVNTTPGTTDMTAAINAADAAVCSGLDSNYIGVTVDAQGTVQFVPRQVYKVTGLTYRGAPWQLNEAVIDYFGSGAAITAVGTNAHRKILSIANGIIYGGSGHATGSGFGINLGYNMRSYRALDNVIFLGFPGPGIHFSAPHWDMSFYDVQVLSCATTSGAGIDFEAAVTDSNQINWYNPVLENNGRAASGAGGGIDSNAAGAGALHQWAVFGGLFTSNLGVGEVRFVTGSNINFFGTYFESAGTGQVSNALYFNNVISVGVHDCYFTGSANTGAAVQFTNGTVGVVDNIRNTGNWTLSLDSNTSSQMYVTSPGSLTAGVSSAINIGTGSIISWPSKNQNGSPIQIQRTPSTPTVATTLTAANLLIGILTATPDATGATHAYTLPTGANMETVAAFVDNDSFDWSITNLAAAAADTITITANTNHTIVGNPIVQSANAATGGIYGNSAVFRSRRTSGSVWVTYRYA